MVGIAYGWERGAMSKKMVSTGMFLDARTMIVGMMLITY